MFTGKILIGVWEEETIILKGMPKDFVLSARSFVVLERKEYEQLHTEIKQLKTQLHPNELEQNMIDAIDEGKTLKE